MAARNASRASSGSGPSSEPGRTRGGGGPAGLRPRLRSGLRTLHVEDARPGHRLKRHLAGHALDITPLHHHVMGGPDAREGLASHTEKRDPVFRGPTGE